MEDKDIRFTEKKVDESWKEQAGRDKERLKPASAPQPPHSQPDSPQPQTATASASVSSKPFMNLLSSLGYQAMMHLGEIPDPGTQEKIMDLEAAREIIDLLTALREKSSGHLSAEEERIFETLLPSLQMKFSQKV